MPTSPRDIPALAAEFAEAHPELDPDQQRSLVVDGASVCDVSPEGAALPSARL